MRWRHGFSLLLEEDTVALDRGRDKFIERLLRQILGDSTRREDFHGIESLGEWLLGEWLLEERQRIVRMNEMRCEECWCRAVTAKDDERRTPLHWASSGA